MKIVSRFGACGVGARESLQVLADFIEGKCRHYDAHQHCCGRDHNSIARAHAHLVRFDVIFFPLPVNQLFELLYGRTHFVSLVVPVIRSWTGLLHCVPKTLVRCFKLRPLFTIGERAHPGSFDLAIDLPLVIFELLLRWEAQTIIRLVRDHGTGLGSYLARGL